METRKTLVVGGIELTDEMMAGYVRAARARSAAHDRAVEARRTRARDLARQAAILLREEFGASRVVLFGSLAGSAPFHLTSDVDLAVWDLPESMYLKALGRLLDLDPEFEFDLVRVEEARPALLEAISRDGVVL